MKLPLNLNMNFFHNRLDDALKELEKGASSLDEASYSSDTEDKTRKLESAYRDAHRILDEHLRVEFSDDQSIGGLISKFNDYKAKLEEARLMLDSDFSMDSINLPPQVARKDVFLAKNLSSNLPEIRNLLQKAKQDLKFIEATLKKLLKDEKINLE